MSKITRSDVISVIEKALEMKPGTIGDNTQADEIGDWDSLGQLSILVALDKLFDGKIARIGGMADADSVPKIITLLSKNSLL